MRRTAFFISDGTGITAEALGHSLLTQFENIRFDQITLPYIDTPEKARNALIQINKTAAYDDGRPIIFDTIVNNEVRAIIAEADAFMVDIFGTFLAPLEDELAARSSYTVGKTHAISEERRYKQRIEAVNFAMDNDDGAKIKHYDEADIILIGVSRCGKTPTCLYMAMQFGIRAANYPLTEEDMDDCMRLKMPTALKNYRHKLFGLSIEAEQLCAIRQERRPNSPYASYELCEHETKEALALFQRERIAYIDTTRLSVEEISTRILAQAGLERHLK
ncbi:posphoenolpyruvate synthetase regulatory kinase/phosphorylase PpsR [Balneatrix alpica]|uniref:Putative phosphoenolpyruvate synthase regulatory protein n=1 Tax=Balneatrix alpica TaxID=75684 RepID=A0ABV5Z6N2_9GAMM|nr:pyruvate, water dikinase regulatory protein [Balneatrix alpica]